MEWRTHYTLLSVLGALSILGNLLLYWPDADTNIFQVIQTAGYAYHASFTNMIYGLNNTIVLNNNQSYQFPFYNICIFVFATTKTEEHLFEIEQVFKTWGSPNKANNVWFVWDQHESYDLSHSESSFNICQIHDTYPYTYDNCIFLADTPEHIAKYSSKNPLQKKLWDSLKYINHPTIDHHAHLAQQCNAFVKIDSDSYVTLDRLNSIFGWMDGMSENELWFIGPAWNKIRRGNTVVNFPLGYGMGISNALFHFIFDDNTLPKLKNKLDDYKDLDLLSKFTPILPNQSIIDHCYKFYFYPTDKKTGKVGLNPHRNSAAGSDDVALAHCLFSLFRLDRIQVVEAIHGLYAGASWNKQLQKWSLNSLKTARYDNNELQTYIWHQINSSEMIQIHEWFQKESTNNQSKYFQQLNHRYEHEKPSNMVCRHDLMNRNWKLINRTLFKRKLNHHQTALSHLLKKKNH